MRTQKSKQKPKRKTVTKAGKPAGKPYETGLDRVAANYQPLTPLSFLERAARTFEESYAAAAALDAR